MSEFMKITISPISVYDLLIESNHYDVDWDSEYQKIRHTERLRPSLRNTLVMN